MKRRSMLGQTYGKWEESAHWRVGGTSVGKSHRRQARAIEKRKWRRDPEAA